LLLALRAAGAACCWCCVLLVLPCHTFEVVSLAWRFLVEQREFEAGSGVEVGWRKRSFRRVQEYGQLARRIQALGAYQQAPAEAQE
jgi:hypothetical protein